MAWLRRFMPVFAVIFLTCCQVSAAVFPEDYPAGENSVLNIAQDEGAPEADPDSPENADEEEGNPDPFTYLEWYVAVDPALMAQSPLPQVVFRDILVQLGATVTDVWSGEVIIWSEGLIVPVLVYTVTGLTNPIYKFLANHSWVVVILRGGTEIISARSLEVASL